MSRPLSESELAMLKLCADPVAFNRVALTIVLSRAGQYPCDWKQRVVDSGLLKQLKESWYRDN